MTPEKFDLLSKLPSQSIISIYEGEAIDNSLFIKHLGIIQKLLPNKRYCINLCENRYLFLLLFVASNSLNQTSILPHSRTQKELQRLKEKYPDSYHLADEVLKPAFGRSEQTGNAFPLEKKLLVDIDHTAVIVFTSGTTGTPTENKKSWRQLLESARRTTQRFNFDSDKQHSLVATVPPQHMFGFETTIILPLLCNVTIHAGRPFYPLDIQQALSETSSPRVLVTIPLHLKSIISLNTNWPKIDFVISATAPMPNKLALDSESILLTQVKEIYGCSELGAIATRQLTKDNRWKLLTDFKLVDDSIQAPGVIGMIKVPDKLEAAGQGHFNLVGRDSDLVNIGGKRGSLGDLNNKIRSIKGVDDAVFILPDERFSKRTRLIAFVVSSQFNATQLRQLLALHIDAVFLPRPIIIVEKLPYNDLGKLPRENLLALLKKTL